MIQAVVAGFNPVSKRIPNPGGSVICLLRTMKHSNSPHRLLAFKNANGQSAENGINGAHCFEWSNLQPARCARRGCANNKIQ